MKPRSIWAGLACVALCACAQPAFADTPDPLRLVPEEAGLVIKIERPGVLVRSVAELEIVQDLQKIEAVRELLDSTNTRRFKQLVDYFERKLSARDYYDLFDKVAGGGIVIAARLEKEAPALVVIQGKDEKAVQEFVRLAVEVVLPG